MARELTTRLKLYVEIAMDAGLDDPLGRAVYTANRKIMSGGKPAIDIMKRCRPDTAQRWRWHWENGGSLRSLKRSHEQQQRIDEWRRDRGLSDGERLRRVVRRLRRKIRNGDIEVPTGD